VQTTDCGSEIPLGGGGNTYAVTVGAASGFPASCRIRLTNSETWSAPGGKSIQISGFANFILWPGQGNATPTLLAGNSVEIVNVSNTWVTSAGVPRARAPTGAVIFNVDPTNGTDTIGATDGLGTGTRAFHSINYCLFYIADQFQFNSSTNSTTATCLLAAGATDTTQVHLPVHGLAGGSGSAALTIDLNGGTLNATTGSSVQCFFGTVLRIRNGTLAATSANSDALDVLQGCMVYLLDGITFGAIPASTAHINIAQGGKLLLVNSYSISAAGGAASFHINCVGGNITTGGAITVTALANFTVNAVVNDQFCYIGTSQVTWTVGAFTVTGKKFNVIENGVLEGSAAVFGASAGTTASGGQAL
jgi:hypothetical protein